MTKNPEGLRRDATLLLEHKPYCSQDEFESAARELARDYGLGNNGEVWDYLAKIDAEHGEDVDELSLRSD